MAEQLQRERISNFYLHHLDKGKSYTVRHFLCEGIARSTTYEILKKLETRKDISRKPGSGGINRKLSNSQRAAIGRWLNNRRGVSLRREAKKYGVAEKTMRRIVRTQGLKCRKRIKAPQYTAQQQETIKEKAQKLLRVLRGKKILMDDESYFKLKCDYLPGNDHIYTSDLSTAPPDAKFRTERKFPVQLMVWICISEDAVSDVVFLERPNSVNADFYMKECISDKLTKFISDFHEDDNFIFWPDLASAHYATATQNLFHQLGIPFVDKAANPPNIPQCRPIENFWAALKAEVYKGGWEASSIPQLRRRIKRSLGNVDMAAVQKDFRSIRGRLKKVAEDGPLSVI
jgi:transposase